MILSGEPEDSDIQGRNNKEEYKTPHDMLSAVGEAAWFWQHIMRGFAVMLIIIERKRKFDYETKGKKDNINMTKEQIIFYDGKKRLNELGKIKTERDLTDEEMKEEDNIKLELWYKIHKYAIELASYLKTYF